LSRSLRGRFLLYCFTRIQLVFLTPISSQGALSPRLLDGCAEDPRIPPSLVRSYMVRFSFWVPRHVMISTCCSGLFSPSSLCVAPLCRVHTTRFCFGCLVTFLCSDHAANSKRSPGVIFVFYVLQRMSLHLTSLKVVLPWSYALFQDPSP